MSKFIAARIIRDTTSSVLLSELKAAYSAFNNGKTTGIKATIAMIEQQFDSSKVMIGRYVGYSNIAIRKDIATPEKEAPAKSAPQLETNDKMIEIELMKLKLEREKMEMTQRENAAQREFQSKLHIEQLNAQRERSEKQLDSDMKQLDKKLEAQTTMHRETLQDKRERQQLAFEHNREMMDKKLAHETVENNKNRNLLSAKMYIGSWANHGVLPVIGNVSNWWVDSEYVPGVIKSNNPDVTPEQLKEFAKIVAVGSEEVRMSTGETKLGITRNRLSQMCAVASNATFELSEDDRVKIMTEVEGDQTLSNVEDYNTEIKNETTAQTADATGSLSDEEEPLIDEFCPSKSVAEAYASAEIEELIGEAAMSAYINTFINMRTILQSVVNKKSQRKIIKWMNHVATDLSSGLSSVRTPAEVKRDELAAKQNPKKSMPPLLSIMKPENAYDPKTNTFVCYVCSARTHVNDAHRCHIVARANGGDASISNLIAGCSACNIKSGMVDIHDARGIASTVASALA